MERQFIPPKSAVAFYANDMSKRFGQLRKSSYNKARTDLQLKDLAYQEMRNCHKELFENPREWRSAIFKQYKLPEQQEQQKKRTEIRDAGRHASRMEKGLNPHDRDEDEPLKNEAATPSNETKKEPFSFGEHGQGELYSPDEIQIKPKDNGFGKMFLR